MAECFLLPPAQVLVLFLLSALPAQVAECFLPPLALVQILFLLPSLQLQVLLLLAPSPEAKMGVKRRLQALVRVAVLEQLSVPGQTLVSQLGIVSRLDRLAGPVQT